MTKKTADRPIGALRVVKDFLPPPNALVFREECIKVTMVLSKSSVEFFKKEAKKQHAPYQAMIRKLLDAYATHYGRPGMG
ncbi:MAG: CopG family transcriptional regulator [Elusimicrobia bacterium]|nr:CopG family transcriptional regulator [Elusimicrobiota bacterium]